MLRGLEKQQEQAAKFLLRDTRPLFQRMVDFFKDPFNMTFTIIGCGIVGFVFPAIVDICALIGISFYAYTFFERYTLPYRLPKFSNMLDYNDLAPGTHKPRKAAGIYYFGNQLSTNEELWFSNDDMRTHVLIFGSTGSGKTEALISLAYNALSQGSGFIYVDGKGDNTLFAKIFSMVRRMGREDDLLLINFMTGAKDIVGPQEKRLSNTMNPFANGSSSMLSQLVISLMDASSNTPDGDMWKGRAIAFVEALMKILVYMRDKGYILLDANTIRNYFELPRLESIGIDKLFVRDNKEPVSLVDVPPVILDPINAYLATLPGFDRARKGKQVSQVFEQHGYITMQLTRVFSSLADTYGHIIRTNLAEVDVRDVVLNRRILLVLLPALEKSPDELANLGKVVIASLKAMMASGLGEEVEGTYREIILRKPTNAPNPYLCILDEYGYYAVKGFAVVPAQARSLGFSTVFAGQDLPAFQKASKEEAASIGANTNIKICMKLEDPTETWEFFQKTAGEAYVTKVDSFQTNATSITNAYMDTRSASSEKRQRIDLLDLKEQREGEAHIFFRSTIVRAKLFYANPKPVPHMRLNQMIKVEIPAQKSLILLQQNIEKFKTLTEHPLVFENLNLGNEEINHAAQVLNDVAVTDTIERGVNALLALHNRTAAPVAEEMPEVESANELNVFAKLRLPQAGMASLKIKGSVEAFSQPLLNKTQLRDQVAYIERLGGKTENHASNIANEIVKDMEIVTHYPPFIMTPPDIPVMLSQINELIRNIQMRAA